MGLIYQRNEQKNVKLNGGIEAKLWGALCSVSNI